MLRTTLAVALCLTASTTYGASSSTPSMPIDPRIDGVTGCEITSNIAAPLATTVVVLDPDGRQLERAQITLGGFASRLLITDQPADGFHCRFSTDGGKAQYMGAAKYFYIDGDGILVERALLDR
jgi:hypothetical protein